MMGSEEFSDDHFVSSVAIRRKYLHQLNINCSKMPLLNRQTIQQRCLNCRSYQMRREEDDDHYGGGSGLVRNRKETIEAYFKVPYY
jgi:tRNA G37 N-methylase TrmD